MGFFKRRANYDQMEGVTADIGPLYSQPFREHLEGNDTKGVWQLLPFDQQFLTYWLGNQLPQSLRVGIGSKQVSGWYAPTYSQEYALPQLNAGTRPYSLGLVPLSQMLQELRDKWQNVEG